MDSEMQYIYEVYREGSFSKAAKKLFLTQPALSIAIRKVETRLGMPLFDRNQSPLTLTAAGEIYIKKIEKLRQIKEELFAEINDITELRTGSINIGGTNYLNSHILPPVISLFMRKFPGVKLSITEGSSNALLDMIEDNTIDITFNSGQLDSEKFLVTPPVFSDTILLAVPIDYVNKNLLSYSMTKEEVLTKAYSKPSTTPVKLSMFSNVPFILLSPQNNLYQRSMEFFAHSNMEPRVIQVLDQLVTSYHFCCQGIGATFIGSTIISNVSNPNVLYFRIDSPLTLRCFSAVTKKNRYMSIAIREFIKTISEVYPSPTGAHISI